MCGISFGENGDEDLVLSSFSNCKLKYLGPTYFIVHHFILFSLKQQKLNDSLLPVAIRYCIFNQLTIVQIIIPNTDHSLFIFNRLQIALKILVIVQCDFVVETVRMLNKIHSSKVVLSGYFLMLESERTFFFRQDYQIME